MLLQLPSGAWDKTEARGPADLLKLASSQWQLICVSKGGLNPFGKPNFRIVWQPSRFDIFGYSEVPILDSNNKTVDHLSDTVMQLKYCMPEGMDDCYIMEAWRPAEWYASQGRADHEILWHPHGLAAPIRQFSSIPAEGDYEAVELAMNYPAPLFTDIRKFTRQDNGLEFETEPMCRRIIERLIELYHISRDTRLYDRQVKYNIRQQHEDAKRLALYEDTIGESMGPYCITPHSGFGGKTRDIGSTATPTV